MVAYECSWSGLGREDDIASGEDGLDASCACKVPSLVREGNCGLGWQCEPEEQDNRDNKFAQHLFLSSIVRLSRHQKHSAVLAGLWLRRSGCAFGSESPNLQ